MTNTISPYPLVWPDGVPRTPSMRRQRSPFRTALGDAIENVTDSLRKFQKEAGVKTDVALNGRREPALLRKIGFTLLVYPFGTKDGKGAVYASNGASRDDVMAVMRETLGGFARAMAAEEARGSNEPA